MTHSYEHTAGLWCPIAMGAQIYFAEGPEKLAENLTEARPHHNDGGAAPAGGTSSTRAARFALGAGHAAKPVFTALWILANARSKTPPH